MRTLRGVGQALGLVREFRPQALLATGGYVCVPVALAAWLFRCPILIYLPDLEPGSAIRALSRLADRVAVSFQAAADFFPARKVLVSGYPVRASLLAADRSRSREALGLPQEAKVLLIFGGSQGSRSINRAAAEALEPLLARCHVVHISGPLDASWLAERRRALPPGLRERYHLHEYLHEEMASALAAVDLAVARAGAATLGEFPARGLPAIMVPYPHAGAHQERNADHLVERGAAVKLLERDLSGPRLAEAAGALLDDERGLEAMGARMGDLARPEAAGTLAEALRAIAGKAR